MSAGLAGALIGLALGFTNHFFLQRLAERVEKPETERLLQIVGLIELALFPILGLLVGHYVFS